MSTVLYVEKGCVGCTQARVFLAQADVPHAVRDLLEQPLSEAEVRALAARLGGVRELVAPRRRAELEPLSEAQLVKHLAENPGHVRRPLIDTGEQLTAGFTAPVRATLEAEWARKRG